ncbi:MAG: LysR family transcriptional regulator [Pseudomonadota bacterium]
MQIEDWDHLRYFLGVIDAGSVSAAARAMAVEHSTVARRIDALEKNLGLRLFDRLPRGWQLTEEGKALVHPARRIESELHALLRAANAEVPLEGPVRVSAPPALASCLLSRVLPAALAPYPRIALEMIGEAHNTDILRRETDIALRFRRPDSPQVAVKMLATVNYALYACPGYEAARPADAWEFLGFDSSLAELPHALWLDRFAGGRRVAMRSNDLCALAGAALAGHGVALLPSYVAMHAPGLVRLPVECGIARKLWLVMHEDVRRSPRIRTTADALIRVFESAAATL